jgi:hypothetical protein
MSLRFIWRSAVFVLTLLFIYLAFPVLIVPSSLPAIKSIISGESHIQEYKPDSTQVSDYLSADADTQIYQLNIPASTTFSDKLNLLSLLHRQGWQMIFPKD